MKEWLSLLVCQLESVEQLGQCGDRDTHDEATPTGGMRTESNAVDTAERSLGENGEGSTPLCVEGDMTGGFAHLPSTAVVTAPQVATTFVGQQLPPLSAFTGSREGNGYVKS